ncbi:MAG: MMPL family transporter [Planctomycetales bacterium]|nr:MMPL family transporter [Planctomycetales bacterium]
MNRRFGDLVAKHWRLVILCWVIGLLVVCWLTPRWDSVTHDGDLAYLPEDLDSVAGERLLEEAFPIGRSKSEMVVVFARDDFHISVDDQKVIDRIAAQLKNLDAVCELSKDPQSTTAAALLRESLEFDPEFASAWNNLAFCTLAQDKPGEAADYRQLATDYDKSLVSPGDGLLPELAAPLPILDVWTYRHPVFGKQLGSRDKKAQLIVVRLSQEFMATENLALLSDVKSILNEAAAVAPSGLRIGLSGSASVGSEMLQSAAESIASTELLTVILVVAILLVVYRAPLLVTVPLITIVVSIVVAMRLVAALTQVHLLPGFEWWDFKVFTTTRIFVVVILFGAGTDFCLFLISRFREELTTGATNTEAISKTISGVSPALMGSAFTTIVGLAMMFFADFGKFRNSGPAIGFCLAVALAACLTLGPAIVRALGRHVFWPFRIEGHGNQTATSGRFARFWERTASTIVSNPIRVLAICTICMLPFAFVGTSVQVTYNFLSELSPTKPSRIGTDLMQQHFPMGETSPLVVLAKTKRSLSTEEGTSAIRSITSRMYVDGVGAVRSLAAPRGESPEGISIRRTAITAHEITQSLYLSQRPEVGGEVARFEIVLQHDPFSLESIEVLNSLEQLVRHESTDASSFWNGTEFHFTGTTSAIRDLRSVTMGDNVKIQVLVVLGVLAILLVLLRRPLICLYLILSVLLSYYAALGATELFFRFAYGSTFEGLDWKVPLFLFVILVAIGQDYNIYLVTRVFEEQAKIGPFAGLRRAIVQTGGIITSCGVIMAGTFVSMTTGTLRGIVELGFALSLGVLLDTFVVRPILVPAFLALLCRWEAAKGLVTPAAPSPSGSD